MMRIRWRWYFMFNYLLNFLGYYKKTVWKRNQPDVTFCYPLFLLYKLLNMFRATMCPYSGADDNAVLSPRVGIVPWLQEGCQNRLAASVSIEEFVAQLLSCATNNHGTIRTHGDNTTQSSAPEYGHMVARNVLSNL